MKRRSAIKTIAIAPTIFISTPDVAHAVLLPAIPTLIDVVVFFIRRYVVDSVAAAFRILFPAYAGSKTREYLLKAALSFGFDKIKAEIIADRAEATGVENIATNGKKLVADIVIENKNKIPLELTDLRVLLVDVKKNTIELQSAPLWGIVVFPGHTAARQIEATNFPQLGLKQLYIANESVVVAKSKPFLVV